MPQLATMYALTFAKCQYWIFLDFLDFLLEIVATSASVQDLYLRLSSDKFNTVPKTNKTQYSIISIRVEPLKLEKQLNHIAFKRDGLTFSL